MLKRFFFIMVVALMTLQVQAQGKPKFNPARFQADLEQFITTEAGLNARQAAVFFPSLGRCRTSSARSSTRCAVTSMWTPATRKPQRRLSENATSSTFRSSSCSRNTTRNFAKCSLPVSYGISYVPKRSFTAKLFSGW